jgi:hypothetical protein
MLESIFLVDFKRQYSAPLNLRRLPACLCTARFSGRKTRTAKVARRIEWRLRYAEILGGRYLHLRGSLTKLTALRAVCTLLGGWG